MDRAKYYIDSINREVASLEKSENRMEKLKAIHLEMPYHPEEEKRSNFSFGLTQENIQTNKNFDKTKHFIGLVLEFLLTVVLSFITLFAALIFWLPEVSKAQQTVGIVAVLLFSLVMAFKN